MSLSSDLLKRVVAISAAVPRDDPILTHSLVQHCRAAGLTSIPVTCIIYLIDALADDPARVNDLVKVLHELVAPYLLRRDNPTDAQMRRECKRLLDDFAPADVADTNQLPRGFDFSVHIACITHCTPPVLAELARDMRRSDLPLLERAHVNPDAETFIGDTLAHIICRQPSDVVVLEGMLTSYEVSSVDGVTGYVVPCKATLALLIAIVRDVLKSKTTR